MMKITRLILDNTVASLLVSLQANELTNSDDLSLTYEYLRVYSPTDKRSKSTGIPEVYHQRMVRLLAIEPVGKHGYRLIFDDSHQAIYSEDYIIELFKHKEAFWQRYLTSLTATNNREPSIAFKAL